PSLDSLAARVGCLCAWSGGSWLGGGWGPGWSVLACESPGHEGGHRPLDHGLGVLGGAFVVPHGAPVVADPRERPFHDPAGGEHVESGREALADDLDPQPQGGRCPADQPARVASVRPDVADPPGGGAAAAQEPGGGG